MNNINSVSFRLAAGLAFGISMVGFGGCQHSPPSSQNPEPSQAAEIKPAPTVAAAAEIKPPPSRVAVSDINRRNQTATKPGSGKRYQIPINRAR
ncbi:MAG: hypothetical protein B6247_09575 [Candidatus Parabeggiatoa sp. nov. 2]|nr:MAG: hypothetical protein B6247_09575 [Beggiatoa sp. 4572_84]